MESVGIMENRKKTYIADIERGVYDIRMKSIIDIKLKKGLLQKLLKKFQKEKMSLNG